MMAAPSVRTNVKTPQRGVSTRTPTREIRLAAQIWANSPYPN